MLAYLGDPVHVQPPPVAAGEVGEVDLIPVGRDHVEVQVGDALPVEREAGVAPPHTHARVAPVSKILS